MSDHSSQCEALIQEAYLSTSSHPRHFPTGKTIIIWSHRGIALLGMVFRDCRAPNSHSRMKTFDLNDKEKFKTLAGFGVRAYCYIWLDNMTYVFCTFIKVQNGVEEKTRRPISSMAESMKVPNILQFVDKDCKALYNERPNRGGH